MMYQHLRRPTAMPYGTTLHVFTKGIKPVWEDPALEKGARFQLKSAKSHTSKYWEDLLLALIGEQIGSKTDMVAGLVLNLKPQFDKIGIWITDCEDEEEISKVKINIIEILQVNEKDIEYEVFRELSNKKPNFIKKSNRGGFKKHSRGGRGGVDGTEFQRATVTEKREPANNDFSRADKN